MNPLELPELPGIYLIECKPTGDTYVGQAQNLRARCNGHIAHTRTRHVKSRKWMRLAEIPAEQFRITVLELCAVEDLCDREFHWISELHPTLNVQSPTGYTAACATFNVEIPTELMTRLKVAKAMTETPIREIAKLAIDAWLRAQGFTPEKMPKVKSGK